MELTIIPLLAEFPWNAILCIAIVVLTFYLFLFNRSFQATLISVKNWYEGKAR